MKVMLPLDEDKLNICVSFGRAPFFLLYDLEKHKEEYLENPAANVEGGAGIKAAQFLVDEGANILITFRCGENAAEVFKQAGIKIYKACGSEVKKNIEDLKENKLEVLTHFHAGYQGIR